MKIKPEHYAHLKSEIQKLPKDQVLRHKEYLKGDIRVKDLGRHWRWDIYWATKPHHFGFDFYTYLNDTHIDTALKKIMGELELTV